MTRPTIPGGAFLPGSVPGGNPLEEYLEGLIAGATEEALAGKADAAEFSSLTNYATFQAAVAAQKPIFIPGGAYHITETVRVPNGGKLMLWAQPGTVTITGANGVTLFGRDSAFGSTVKEVRLRGIRFNGQRVRRNHPYNDPTGDTYGFFTLMDISAAQDDASSRVDIQDCEFDNIAHLPFVVDHFHSVLVQNNKFTRCKDPGLRFCNRVIFQGNVSEFGSDNGFSISRGCRYVSVVNNIIKDPEIAGIWLSGFDVAGSEIATLSGASYGAGGSLTLTVSAGLFSAGSLGQHIVLTGSDSSTATVKITAVSSSTVAAVKALSAIPASLQGVAASSWRWAPHTGVDQYTVTGNVVVGALSASVHTGVAARRGVITGNTFLRTGYQADSEKATTGSIVSGATTLTVANSADFAVNSWVLVEPRTSFQDYFVAQITAKAGNDLTLSVAAPRSYVDEPVRLLHVSASEGWGVFATGSVRGGDQYAENIHIADNVFEGWRQAAVFLGNSGNGSARRITVRDNDFWQDASLPLVSGRTVIRIAEQTGTEAQDILIRGNGTTATTDFVVALVRGTARRRIVVDANYAPNVPSTNYMRVLDVDNASANISNLYPYTRTDDYGVTRSTVSKIDAWNAETISAGVVSVKSSAITVTPTVANEDITAFTNQLGSGGLTEFRLRNASGTNTITLKHDATKLITKTGADVVVPPRTVVSFVFVNSTVVAQDG